MCGQSVNQGANVEFRGRFKWHRLFQIGSGCSLWWAGTTAELPAETSRQAAQLLRQPTCLQASRGQNAAAIPASRGLKHETCFLSDATNPQEDEGTSDFIHGFFLMAKGDLNLNSLEICCRKHGVRDNLSRVMLNGISCSVRNLFNLNPS